MPLRVIVWVEALLAIVNWPAYDPNLPGSNCTSNVSDCPGFNVTGSEAPVTENPVPLTLAEFTVTAAVPLDVRVTVCVVALFTTTLPNEMLVAFRASDPVAAFSCNETACEVLPVAAVTVAVCAVLTEAAFAVNVALVDVAGTVTEPGTVTALLLLARDTLRPLVGAEPDRRTVQVSANDPVIDVLLQDNALTFGSTVVPVPLRLTVAVGALLARVNCPVVELAVVGSN